MAKEWKMKRGEKTHAVQVKVTPDGKGRADTGHGDDECHGVEL